MPRITNNHQKPGNEMKSTSQPPKKNHSRQHLDFRLLASKAVREWISVLSQSVRDNNGSSRKHTPPSASNGCTLEISMLPSAPDNSGAHQHLRLRPILCPLASKESCFPSLMTLILRTCPTEAWCQCCAEDQGLLLRLSTGSLWGSFWWVYSSKFHSHPSTNSAGV